MRFWDASAIVPLLVSESQTDFCRGLLQDDSACVVWWATSVECVSAIVRASREELLDPKETPRALRRLSALAELWAEVNPTVPLRHSAERLLQMHSLRAADSLQLAAAIAWCEGETTTREFISFDTRLSTAARAEGFTVVPQSVLEQDQP